jgi:Holliday junction resolvasome RuvABC ATP-dependent DNA helicase subunit
MYRLEEDKINGEIMKQRYEKSWGRPVDYDREYPYGEGTITFCKDGSVRVDKSTSLIETLTEKPASYAERKERLEKLMPGVTDDKVTVVVEVLNGDTGIVRNTSSRGLFQAGMAAIHPSFHDYRTGEMVNVICIVDSEGLLAVSVGLSKKKEGDYPPSSLSAYEIKWRIAGVEGKTKVETTVKENEVAPAVTNGYYISPEARLVFTSAKRLSEARPERAVKLMMVGASGYGKTTLPRQFAERTGMNFLRMNCATIRDPEEWFGYREAREGTTVFVRSSFARAIEEGNIVIVLDEFNRLEPWLHNTLFPLLDDDGRTVVHEEEFSIGPNVVVVGTINTGYRYTGTFELDEALYNRFDLVLEVVAMPHNEEVRVLEARTGIEKNLAVDIVKMANRLRTMAVACSTRTTLLVAAMVSVGMSMREAYESAVIKRIPADNAGVNLRKQALDAVNVNLGVLSEHSIKGDVFAAVESETPKVAAGYTFRLGLGTAPFQLALCISTIRKLTFAGEQLSQKEAHKIAMNLRDGVTMEVELTTDTISASLFESLEKAGVSITKVSA